MKKPGPIDPFKDIAKDYAEKMPELKHIMETWRNDEEFGRQVCFQGFQKNSINLKLHSTKHIRGFAKLSSVDWQPGC